MEIKFSTIPPDGIYERAREIFRGDIVTVKSSLDFKIPAEIWYNAKKAKFDLRNKEVEHSMFDIGIFELEIIGDVYTSPELLK